MIIIHFALKNEWDTESKQEFYGTSCIEKNNKISCYKISDVTDIKLNLSTLNEYVILCIDESKLTSEVKYEKLDDSDFIRPNIYGKINTDAVIQVLPYTFDSEDNFVATKELLDFNAINEVCANLKISYESHKNFHDGTYSRIILLNNQYIIKQADSIQLKAEVTFASTYNMPMLQKIAYFDKEYRFVVYYFIPGDVMHTVSDFEDLSSAIKRIANSYKNFSNENYGYIETPSNTWNEFLKNEVKISSSYLPDFDYLLPTVEEAINELDKYPFDKKLIHGDFGTHNFIKKDEKFIAAIDPVPLIGDPTYDLLFALVSNIDLLPYLSTQFLTNYIGEPQSKVLALFKVVLYCRICKCAKYNKDWIEPYMDFWNNLFN